MTPSVALIALSLLTAAISEAAPKKVGLIGVKDFAEDDLIYGVSDKDEKERAAERLKKIRELKSRLNKEMTVEGGILNNYSASAKRTRPPAFISARELPSMARIVGPSGSSTGIRLQSTVYLRWNSPSPPREGDEYDTFTPALVLQNVADPTIFDVGTVADLNKIPKGFRPAGFLYEASGRVRITEIDKGLVGAEVIQIRSMLRMEDRVMPALPTYASVEPVYVPTETNAVVVAGFPVERLSTTIGSFLFLNRGQRDGVQLGQVFESVENIQTSDGAVSNKSVYQGKVKVIYVSDSYSTAMITEQFDVIRIGSVLRGAQNPGGEHTDPTEIPKVASDQLPISPGQQPPTLDPEMSELDKVEKQFQAKNLSAEERERLRKLEQQKKRAKKSSNPEELPEEPPAQTPGSSDVVNPFQEEPSQGAKKNEKADKKKNAKKAPGRRDEEQLNELIQMN